jgi:hypothetical protein
MLQVNIPGIAANCFGLVVLSMRSWVRWRPAACATAATSGFKQPVTGRTSVVACMKMMSLLV